MFNIDYAYYASVKSFANRRWLAADAALGSWNEPVQRRRLRTVRTEVTQRYTERLLEPTDETEQLWASKNCSGPVQQVLHLFRRQWYID